MTTSEPTGSSTPVPLTILTGFLGAGKTTLLNRLLNSEHGLRMAVLVNDFGAVNIDAELVVGVTDDMISLANGCVCCQIRDDLLGAVDQLLASDDPPQYIVLEASGVADPAGIWATFTDSAHRDRLRLDSVTCVVDADQLFAHVDEAPDLMMLKARQIGFADLVVLNKVDLAGPEQVALVRRWIDGMMNRVRVVEATYCDVPDEVLFGVGRFDPAARLTPAFDPGDHDHVGHGARFDTWVYESGTPFSAAALEEMIRRDLPGSVYRCKGVVYVEEDADRRDLEQGDRGEAHHTERRMVLQSVGRRSELTAAGPGGGEAPRSRIVAIGRAGGLDPEGLRRAFDGCLAR